MIGDARRAVATALEGLAVPIHAYPPSVVSPSAVLVVPGPAYFKTRDLAGGAVIGLEVLIIVALHNAALLDDLVEAAVGALIAAGIHPDGAVQAPDTDLEAVTITARIPVILRWKE